MLQSRQLHSVEMLDEQCDERQAPEDLAWPRKSKSCGEFVVMTLTERLAGKPSHFGRLETIRCAAERFSVRSSGSEKLCPLKSQSPFHMNFVIVRRNQCPKTCIHAWHVWDSLNLQPHFVISIFGRIFFCHTARFTEVILSSAVVDKRSFVSFFSLF